MLWSYLLYYRYTVFVYLLFAVIFTVVFMLYDLELEAVFYAGGLCTLIGLALFCIRFPRYCSRHNKLIRIRENIALFTDQLPEPRNLLESDYTELILALQSVYRGSQTEWHSRRNESIDYYTTWVHQIKTPIAAMRMMLQGEDSAEHRALSSELFRIEQYVEMVLSYFRLDSSSSDFVFQTYAIDDIIRQAVHKYAPQFIHKRIGLQYEPIKWTALTDEKWLLFILEQLLSNAIKYTEKGTVTISSPERQILQIADTGIGIAPEDLPRIFEKGFTGYNGRSDKKSTGLGLYLCKQAADKLSHKISVTSEVGAGTTFTIDLRAADLEVE